MTVLRDKAAARLPCCDLGRWDAAECGCGHGHVGGQRLRCKISRQTGEEASPDQGNPRDRSTAEPISREQPCMRWFRPAFAIALDCAVTRAGDSAWAPTRNWMGASKSAVEGHAGRGITGFRRG